jgi:EpsI family protein
MISRRTLLPAFALLATGGAAQVLHPKEIPAEKQLNLQKILPAKLGDWSQMPASGVVQPDETSDLAHEIYSQELMRSYVNSDGAAIMLLMAYGPSQSQYLQLHRPEICYLANGFNVTSIGLHNLALARGNALPITRLYTWREGRPEPLSYWMRIGDSNPPSQLGRLWVKFRLGLEGEIPDGLLVRVSSISANQAYAFELQDNFIRNMLKAIAPPNRQFVVGALAEAIGT